MFPQDDHSRRQTANEPGAARATGLRATGHGDLPAGIRRLCVDVDGRAVNCLEGGTGVPLILLHGIGSCAESWLPIVPLLADRHRVIAWDMPGYGASAALGEPRPTAAPYAAALVALLRHLDVGPAHLLGHSLGALVAAEFAAARPEMVRSLALVSPAVGSASPVGMPMPAAIEQRITDLSAQGPMAFARKRAANLCGDMPPPAAVRAVEDAMSRVRMLGYGQACWLLAQGDLIAAVRKTAAPGLVVGSAQDKVVPAARAKELAEHWPGARYREIAGVGHAGYVEDPRAYVAPIRAFIDDITERV